MATEQLRITRLCLVNFKNHSKLDVNFDDLNVIIGENGGGKTSILEAICYALFGVVSNGSKKNELIRYGEKTGSVTLYLSNNYRIIRDFSNGSKLIDDKNNIITEKASDIESYLNIDKNVFLNILYASQNDIYNYFLKFNAKEKDFIDGIFNLSSLTDNVSNSVKTSIDRLKQQYYMISQKIESRKAVENTVKDIYNKYKIQNIEELERIVKISYDNLQSLNSRQNVLMSKHKDEGEKNRMQDSIRFVQDRISNISKQQKHLKIDEHKKQLDECLSRYSSELNVSITLDNLNEIYKRLDDMCNMTTYINYIRENLKNGYELITNSGDMKKILDNISSAIESITKVDEYRRYCNHAKNELNSAIQSYSNSYNIIQHNEKEVKDLTSQLSKYNNQLKEIDKKIQSYNIDSNEDFDDFFNMLREYQSNYSELNSTLSTIKNCMSSLNSDNNVSDEKYLESISRYIQLLTDIQPMFGRDGFVSFLRKSILKDIAISIGNQLEKFSFMKLIPVDINDKDGSLTFNNRPFRSLSGGEKTIVAILLRILYAKLLAPSMRLNLILLDEPTDSLDSIRVGYLRQLLININDSFNTQIILVTHDEQVIPDNCNKININTNF